LQGVAELDEWGLVLRKVDKRRT